MKKLLILILFLVGCADEPYPQEHMVCTSNNQVIVDCNVYTCVSCRAIHISNWEANTFTCTDGAMYSLKNVDCKLSPIVEKTGK